MAETLTAWNILSWVTFIPLLGVFALLFVPRTNRRAILGGATAVAVIGLSTPREMRVPNCPSSATGLSGVMSMVAAPMCSSAAADSIAAAAIRNRRTGVVG